jgi:sterol desaturase/sphingolipid hydroxylase (fatty acid hydroxylase superfamily)
MNSNFGATFTFWDKISGTFYLPDNLEFTDLGTPNMEKDPYLKKNFLLRFFHLKTFSLTKRK